MMMNKESLIQIAKSYIEQHQHTYPFMAKGGYVRILEGEACGWCAEKGNANTEKAMTFLVSTHNEVFEVQLKNNKKGSKKWVSW